MAEIKNKFVNKWWRDRVIYHIYPRSFYDSNGDGIGDLQGIIAKLDYLKELGVGAIWLSPVFVSPNVDNGYDVADYYDINPEYGSMDDMKQLLHEAAGRDIKVLMDLVINHTSDQHPWFMESRNPESPYRDYYIWQKPQIASNGKEKLPNNWTSFFTGPAWTKDELSGEYYLHLFTKHQPDLNYHNPKVLAEIKRIMRFWLDMGVAGFRCDVINLIYKESLEDGAQRMLVTGSEHYLSKEGCHRILQEFHDEVWQPYGAFILGEIHNDGLESVKKFVRGNELTIAMAFEHMVFKVGYRANKVVRALQKWQKEIAWNPVFFENHDGMRSVSRFGNDKDFHYESATMLATLTLTLRGTPLIYQGQEIGMTNVPFNSISQLNDVVSLSVYKLLKKFWVPSRLAFKLVMNLCRDHSRTPMQWDDSDQAGFTTGKPWLMVNLNYEQINAKRAMTDIDSVWHYYRTLLEMRVNTPALHHGTIKFLPSNREVLDYERVEGVSRYRVVVNLSGKKRSVKTRMLGKIVMSNYREIHEQQVNRLRPYEAVVLNIV